MSDYKKIHDRLVKIKTSRIDSYGICSNVSNESILNNTGILMGVFNYGESIIWEKWSRSVFSQYPNYSGDIEYPLSSCNKRKSAKIAYRDAQNNGTLWSKRSHYGRERHKLLDFMIAECEKML